MYISTETDSLASFYASYEERLSALKEAGFDAYDFSMFNASSCPWIGENEYAEKVKALRKYADSIGIVCNQTHAPFPLVFSDSEEKTKARFAEIVRALEISAILGAKLSVVHPGNSPMPQENAKLYKRFEPYAKKFGIRIALENMWGWDNENGHALPGACSDGANFNAHLDLLDETVFCALVDVGHGEMKGLDTSAEKMIRALGGRVKGIHLHDNDLIHDTHTLPFTRNIKYAPIIAALKDIGYDGDITLESDAFLPKFPKQLVPAALTFMAAIADYIRKELTNSR